MIVKQEGLITIKELYDALKEYIEQGDGNTPVLIHLNYSESKDSDKEINLVSNLTHVSKCQIAPDKNEFSNEDALIISNSKHIIPVLPGVPLTIIN